jgi:hypothetical protein
MPFLLFMDIFDCLCLDVRTLGGFCQPKPTDGHRQATQEPGGPEPLSVGPAARTRPEVEVRWACHLTYT